MKTKFETGFKESYKFYKASAQNYPYKIF